MEKDEYGKIGKGVSLYCINLCSWGDSGDWEVFPSEELTLPIKELVAILSEKGWTVVASGETVILAGQGQQKITLFRSGRIIIERVRPDRKDIALHIASDILTGYL